MTKVAITGGIGSGKSIVCKILETLGYPVYYSDKRAKILIDTSPSIKKTLKELYGQDIYLKEHINKKKLADIIFKSKKELTKVNSIVHPEVENDFKKWTAEQKGNIVFKESAIIFESHLENLFDYIICISADTETRIQRVIKRESCTRDSITERIDNQLSQRTVSERSDYTINNSNNKALLPQIINIINDIK